MAVHFRNSIMNLDKELQDVLIMGHLSAHRDELALEKKLVIIHDLKQNGARRFTVFAVCPFVGPCISSCIASTRSVIKI